MKSFSIYFEDLEPRAQKNLLNKFDTKEKDENWDTMPLAVIEREEKEEGEEGEEDNYTLYNT